MHFPNGAGSRHKLVMDILAPFRRLRSPEAKSFAAPEPWLSELFGAAPTSSGAVIGVEAALRVPAVASAVRVISDAAATLDVAIREVGADGVETEAPDHPAQAFLGGAVNDWTSGAELIRDLVIDALTRDQGGTAVVARNPAGQLVEIVRYAPGTVQVWFDPATGEPSFRSASAEVIPSAGVIHLRAPFGRAPLSLAREAIGAAAVMERYAAQLFGRGARPSGALSFPKGTGEAAIKRARDAWRAVHDGPDNSGRTAILFDGVTFEPLSITSADAQFCQLRTFQVIEIARAFRVPPSMVYELDRATWSNTEQMGKEFLAYTLEPWLRGLEAALGRALFTPEERGRFRVRFDRDDLTRADLSTRATTINSLIAAQVINPNEGRAWLGLGPRPGGDAFLNPNITAEPAPERGQEAPHGPE